VRQHEHSQYIEAVSRKIVKVIGNGRRTADEVLEECFPDDFTTVNESLGILMQKETIGNEVVETLDRSNVSHKARVYFVKQ